MKIILGGRAVGAGKQLNVLNTNINKIILI